MILVEKNKSNSLEIRNKIFQFLIEKFMKVYIDDMLTKNIKDIDHIKIYEPWNQFFKY